MKVSKEDLKKRISDSITDNDDLVISLLEDIEDSMVEDSNQTIINETLTRENEELKWKLSDLSQRYKERFLKGEEIEDKEIEDKEDEVVDIKEI